MEYEEAKERVLKKIDEMAESMIEFLQELVRIPSPEGEGIEVQEFVKSYLMGIGADKVDMFYPDIEKLKEHPGFSPMMYPEHGGRRIEEKPVIWGTFKGRGGGKSLLFTGHMESATGAWEPGIVRHWKHDPFGGIIEGDALYGKAVVNMKSGNAAAISAIRAIRAAGIPLKGDVYINTNIDEDIGCYGSLEAIRRGYRADAGINPEPTAHTIGIASTGCQHFRVIVRGKPTYTGGISAIENAFKVYKVIKDLDKYRREKYIKPFFEKHPYIQSGYSPGITIGMLRSGVWPCTTPYEAEIEGSIRHVPGENIEEVRAQLREWIMREAEKDPSMKDDPPTVEFWEYWWDTLIEPDEPIVKTLKEAFVEIKGKEPEYSASVGDAAPFTRFGNTPTVYFGPQSIYEREAEQGKVALSFQEKYRGEAPVEEASALLEEAISLSSYIETVKIFALAILKWCEVE